MDSVKIGRAIQVLRRRIGYTQHDLADSIGVTDKAVSKWERGISVPDISIITRLSFLLNCDVDNLLEGNIANIEEPWQGLIVLDPLKQCIYSGTRIYSKPLVYLPISYLLLASIKDVYIICSEPDKEYISSLALNQKIGSNLIFIKNYDELPKKNTMLVNGYEFFYGANLTRYFQRAISKVDRISCLTVNRGHGEFPIKFDNRRLIQESNSSQWYCSNVFFFPAPYLSELGINAHELVSKGVLYAEPMSNGMIDYPITNNDSLLATAEFIHYISKYMGKDIYDLKQIANNRSLNKDVSV